MNEPLSAIFVLWDLFTGNMSLFEVFLVLEVTDGHFEIINFLSLGIGNYYWNSSFTLSSMDVLLVKVRVYSFNIY